MQFANDPDFPYVAKFIVNLTLAQIKTLDCGSERLIYFRKFKSGFDWKVAKSLYSPSTYIPPKQDANLAGGF